MNHAENKVRIATLDSFRCIAILGVLFLHFYTDWTTPYFKTNYYPYGNTLAPYFKYGYYGVNFFFIISGFVIFYTLEKSKHWGDFMIKRFTRLFPAMLIFSLITYFFVNAADSSNQFPPIHPKTALDFLPSLTFTHPIIWVKLFHNSDIYYISGSYWSLWVEVTFYFICSALFFLNKQKFVRNWMLLLIPFTIIRVVGMQRFNISSANPALHFIIAVLKKIGTYFNICDFMIYFSLGILFYCLFFRKKIPRSSLAIAVFFTLLEFYFLSDYVLRMLFLGLLVIFLLFVYKPSYLRFLNNRVMIRIGVISYGLYLVHESIGLILINRLGAYIQSPLLLKIVPVFVMLLLVIFCDLIYRFYEKPVSAWLRSKLLKHGRNTGGELQPK